DLTPRVNNTASLTSHEQKQVLNFLKSENAIFTDKDKMRIYRQTFWSPWSRRAWGSIVEINPAGVAFRVAGIKRDKNGTIGSEYFVFRDDGALKFELRGHPIKH
nr:hypothetical protein [Akkermansiaceae bacterium]